MSDFERHLQVLLNQFTQENESNTPDFILAGYIQTCLDAFNEAVRARDVWYDIKPHPGWTKP